MKRRVVYIAAPLSADTPEGIEENRARGARWVCWAASRGVAPIATWIVMSGVLEETPANRALGLDCDFALIEHSDEVWLVGVRISSGMALEAEHARRIGVEVVDMTEFGSEPPSDEVFAAWLERRAT